MVVKTVQKNENDKDDKDNKDDNDGDNDDDEDDESKKDEKQNYYYDDKEQTVSRKMTLGWATTMIMLYF